MQPEPFSINPPYKALYAISVSFCTASAVRSIEVLSEVMTHLDSGDSEDPLKDIDSHAVLDELQNIIVQGRQFLDTSGPPMVLTKREGEICARCFESQNKARLGPAIYAT